jgi:hypothetical protein
MHCSYSNHGKWQVTMQKLQRSVKRILAVMVVEAVQGHGFPILLDRCMSRLVVALSLPLSPFDFVS